MKKTCLLFVIGVCVASVLYFFLFHFVIPELPIGLKMGLGVLGGFGALALFGATSTVVQGISDKKVLSNAVNHRPPKDGKRAAALGQIEASGLRTVTAPFSGRECLAYEYEVYEMVLARHRGTTHMTKKLHITGFGMVPSHIRTPQAEIRLLGFPLIDEFPKSFTESEEERARADSYSKQTKFQNFKGNFSGIFSEFDDLFQDADGAVRKDLGDPVTIENKHRLTEVIVPHGAEACAIGVYSQSKQALIAKTAALPIRLIPGGAKEAESRLRQKRKGQVGLALIFSLLIHGAFAGIFYSVHKERFNMTEPEQVAALASAAENRDFKKLEWLLKNGVKADATDSHSRTLLQNTRDPDVTRLLIRYGANPNLEDPENLETPLFEAARSGNLERIKALVEGGANVNAVSSIPWNHTPIDEAIREGKYDAIDVLIQAGATDPRVTAANGQALPYDGGEELAVCNQYLQAIQNKNKEILRSITTPRYDYFFDDIDLNLWKEGYPIRILSFEGYSNGTAATVQFRGNRIAGGESEWIFQLQKEADGWKVHQTRPVTGESEYMIWR